MKKLRFTHQPFKPRARLLTLLGDQLIRDAGIAVFELVKNAYDADASFARVTLKNVTDQKRGQIIVEDDGSGMDFDTVTDVWLEPGTDFRGKQLASEKESAKRTRKFNRLPLGEKGVGRFAAHKLGSSITLVTRQENHQEVVVHIDWNQFDTARYLEDVKIEVTERAPEVFKRNATGTRIEIEALRTAWTKKMARDLHRAVTSISSPFDEAGSFRPGLIIEPQSDWLEGLMRFWDVLELSLYRATCVLDGKQLSYQYSFSPLPGMDKVTPRETPRRVMDLPPDKPEESYRWSQQVNQRIGKVELKLHIFDRTPQILALGVTDRKGLREFLNANGGVRVYRDGIRVYNYGESENDWLELGGRRVNVPAKRISSNLVLGAVFLSLTDSKDLVEKTNREGFVENDAYTRFRNAVLFAFLQVERERYIDKRRIRQAYSSSRQREPVIEDLANLRAEVEKRGMEADLGPYLDRIETQFRDVRDTLLTAAGAGLSLAVVIHEVEKGIGELAKAVERDTNINHIRRLAGHLSELVEGLTYLTRKSGWANEKVGTLIRHAMLNTKYRTEYHKITVVNGLEEGNPDFTVKCSRRLIVATLMNLIDNAIYWLDNKGGENKRLFIGTTHEVDGVGAIVVADNGPGFMDPPEYLVEPFLSRKPDGMGLGLHVANEVMKAHGGRLLFPEHGDLDLPRGYGGAVVALIFGEKR